MGGTNAPAAAERPRSTLGGVGGWAAWTGELEAQRSAQAERGNDGVGFLGAQHLKGPVLGCRPALAHPQPGNKGRRRAGADRARKRQAPGVELRRLSGWLLCIRCRVGLMVVIWRKKKNDNCKQPKVVLVGPPSSLSEESEAGGGERSGKDTLHDDCSVFDCVAEASKNGASCTAAQRRRLRPPPHTPSFTSALAPIAWADERRDETQIRPDRFCNRLIFETTRPASQLWWWTALGIEAGVPAAHMSSANNQQAQAPDPSNIGLHSVSSENYRRTPRRFCLTTAIRSLHPPIPWHAQTRPCTDGLHQAGPGAMARRHPRLVPAGGADQGPSN